MTQSDASSDSSFPNVVAVTGPGGLVGTELCRELRARGSRVTGISRSAGPDRVQWDVEQGVLDPSALEGTEAVVHLAGENIGSGRWTDAKKKEFRRSRVTATASLVRSLGELNEKPKTLVCASATGFYGDRGDELLDEYAAAGNGFLAELCKDWEAEAMKARDLGMRVVCVRIGIVLSPKGGALQKMLLPFKMGAGGVVGSGRQYWSVIGLTDLVRVFLFCLENHSLSGPVNAVQPDAPNNSEFTGVLGRVLHRPTFLPLPGFAARLVLGEMADALLLASTRVEPKKLLEAGFQFSQPDLESTLSHELSHA